MRCGTSQKTGLIGCTAQQNKLYTHQNAFLNIFSERQIRTHGKRNGCPDILFPMFSKELSFKFRTSEESNFFEYGSLHNHVRNRFSGTVPKLQNLKNFDAN